VTFILAAEGEHHILLWELPKRATHRH